MAAAGVNFLLSNQQDKAVDLFLDMLKGIQVPLKPTLRSETCSVRVAKLIRYSHPSDLMESASLTYEQRLLTIQQLGRDYTAAGLCRPRGKTCSIQLTDETDFRIGALQQLLQNLPGYQRVAESN